MHARRLRLSNFHPGIIECSRQEPDHRIILFPRSALARGKFEDPLFVQFPWLDYRHCVLDMVRNHRACLNDLIQQTFVLPRRDKNAGVHAV